MADDFITILYDADERIFAPYWSVDAWFMMFLPLVTYDSDGQITPRLARSWESTPDSRHWTFHLRADVSWHDGRPVTAHDIKFSIELAAHPDILFDDAWHDVDSIVVRDDTTLTISYGRPKDGLNTWIVYWPKHLLENLDPSTFFEWDFWVQPIGNGPYRYVRHVPKTMVELRANPDFYTGKPAVDRLVIKFGGSSGILELLSGNVDVLTRLNQADVPKLTTDPRFRIYHHMDGPAPWFNAILWNQRHPALRDRRVRRALTLAIDRRELLLALNLPPDLPITEAPFASRFGADQLPEPLPYDPEQARDLLRKAGWLGTSANTTPQSDENRLRFDALVTSGDVSEHVAVIVQAALRRIGVDMQIRTLQQILVRRLVEAGDFEAAFFPVWNNVDGYLRWFGAEAPLGYDNPEATRLLLESKQTVERSELDPIYAQLATVARRDLPITFLFPQVQTLAVHRRIRGLESPFQANPMQFAERLWIESARR